MNSTLMTQEECMIKYPRLTAHLICESLGYFTPKSAANAISFHKAKQSFACEWYSFMTDRREGTGDGSKFYYHDGLIRTGRNAIRSAFLGRRRHKGYMAEYRRAKELVLASIRKEYDPMFASWF